MNCSVIGDLLPLCADGVAAPESQKLVEEHLLHCSSCRALYEEMCAPVEVQATEQELDYMAAVKRQNRRFLLRLYGSLLAVGLLLVLGWFVREMFRNESLRYAPEPISREMVLQEMPQALLTEEEMALAGQVFSLPQVQQAFTSQVGDSAPEPLPDTLTAELLTQAGKEPQRIDGAAGTVFRNTVWLEYREDGFRYILEFIDADQTGYTDFFRKTVCRDEEDVRQIYTAEINGALLTVSGREEAELSVCYTKTEGNRDWFPFFASESNGADSFP